MVDMDFMLCFVVEPPPDLASANLLPFILDINKN
jgi:hypothetical protein